MTDRLRDKVAVITGAASGIGAAAARLFAQEGAGVVVADVDDTQGPKLAEEIGGLFVRTDVTSPGDVVGMYDAAAAEYGRVDICFNNAGISPPADDSVLETELDVWQRVQAVNLTGVFLCCKHGIPHLLRRGGGSVVNTASFVAVMGAATSQASYTAAK